MNQAHKEMVEQGKLLSELAGNDTAKQMRIISAFAADFRRIINEYEEAHGKECPDKDAIAWIWSVDHHQDIREAAKDI